MKTRLNKELNEEISQLKHVLENNKYKNIIKL